MKLGKVIQYEIKITPSMNFGFMVKVGCGRFAFSSKEDMLKTLTEYLDEPEKFEKEYNSFSSDCEPDREEVHRPLIERAAGRGSSRPQTEAAADNIAR